MFTVKKGGESKTGLKRIILIEDDDSETIVNVSDKIHYIIAFAKTDVAKEGEVAAEVLVKGDVPVLGELYFQLGDQHPELGAHCVRRQTEKIASVIAAEIKRSGIDPISEALKKMPAPEGGTKWN